MCSLGQTHTHQAHQHQAAKPTRNPPSLACSVRTSEHLRTVAETTHNDHKNFPIATRSAQNEGKEKHIFNEVVV
jgi:hypothetical protein